MEVEGGISPQSPPDFQHRDLFSNLTDLERDLLAGNRELEQRVERLKQPWFAGLAVAAGVVGAFAVWAAFWGMSWG